MEIFSLGNIDFDCIRKLNLVHLFVINHRCDLSRFGLCSVHSRKVGGSGRRSIWFFSPEIQSLPFVSLSVPCGKAQAELKDTKEINDNEILSSFPQLACSVTPSHAHGHHDL